MGGVDHPITGLLLLRVCCSSSLPLLDSNPPKSSLFNLWPSSLLIRQPCRVTSSVPTAPPPPGQATRLCDCFDLLLCSDLHGTLLWASLPECLTDTSEQALSPQFSALNSICFLLLFQVKHFRIIFCALSLLFLSTLFGHQILQGHSPVFLNLTLILS